MQLDPLTIPIIFYRNTSSTAEVVRRSTIILRELRVAKAVHVVYSSANINLHYYTYLSSDQPKSLTDLINPHPPNNLHGFQYQVYYKRLYPFFYYIRANDNYFGLDWELTETVATYQNATVLFRHDNNTAHRCPQTPPEVDMNIRRSACSTISVNRLYLPQWDATCVVFPKRHERLVLLQFAKPFQPRAWIVSTIFMIVRFFFTFNRWRLLLLAVLLIEFVLTACYEVKVIEYMTTLRYAPNPKTMDDLINRGERFVVGAPEIDYLEAYGNRIDMEVVAHSKERFLGQRAMLYFCKTAEGYINSALNYNPLTNDRLMIILRERLKPYPSSYGFARDHPLRERFERMLRWMFESGVWRKIYDQYKREEEQFRPLVASGEYLIEFGDLAPLWVVCALGWLVAFGAFAVEIAWKRIGW